MQIVVIPTTQEPDALGSRDIPPFDRTATPSDSAPRGAFTALDWRYIGVRALILIKAGENITRDRRQRLQPTPLPQLTKIKLPDRFTTLVSRGIS
jgi:hypothetical protein